MKNIQEFIATIIAIIIYIPFVIIELIFEFTYKYERNCFNSNRKLINNFCFV